MNIFNEIDRITKELYKAGYTTPKFEPAVEHYEDDEPSDDKRFDDADGVIYENEI